jgi:hypothetical protein
VRRSFYDQFYKGLLTPRLGHLLEIDYPPEATPLRHGLMEASYAAHYSMRGADCSDTVEGGLGVLSGAAAEAGAGLPDGCDAAAAGAAAGEGQGAHGVATGPAALPEGVQHITFTATTSRQGTLLIGAAPRRAPALVWQAMQSALRRDPALRTCPGELALHPAGAC